MLLLIRVVAVVALLCCASFNSATTEWPSRARGAPRARSNELGLRCHRALNPFVRATNMPSFRGVEIVPPPRSESRPFDAASTRQPEVEASKMSEIARTRVRLSDSATQQPRFVRPCRFIVC